MDRRCSYLNFPTVCKIYIPNGAVGPWTLLVPARKEKEASNIIRGSSLLNQHSGCWFALDGENRLRLKLLYAIILKLLVRHCPHFTA